jgi:putative hydrolase of the HAD superfamily
MFDVIAFDADDTLWHNEVLYTETQDKFKELLSDYLSADAVEEALYRTEKQNLHHYGYGIKSFALSMIETAIEVSDGQISGQAIQAVIGLAKDMLNAPVQLLDGVHGVITALSKSYQLMVITKGDLLNQESKVSQSGLAHCFTHIEVVSEKTKDTYQALLTKHCISPRRFLMVGNSLRSDVLPVLAIGGQAAYIPYHTTWAHEIVVNPDQGGKVYHELEHIGQVPALVRRLSQT